MQHHLIHRVELHFQLANVRSIFKPSCSRLQRHQLLKFLLFTVHNFEMLFECLTVCFVCHAVNFCAE
jgi:hypothetical protein